MIGQADKCMLSLYDVYVENVDFKRTDKYSPDKVDLDFNIETKYSKAEDGSQCTISASVSINDLAEKSLSINVILVGVFGLKNFDKLNKKDKKDLLGKNTLAILFPYIRSYITTITSQSGISPIILPPININALIEDNLKNDN